MSINTDGKKEPVNRCIDCNKPLKRAYSGKTVMSKAFCPECKAVRELEERLQGRKILDDAVTQQQEIERIKAKVRKAKHRTEPTMDEVMDMAEKQHLSYGKMRSLLRRAGS